MKSLKSLESRDRGQKRVTWVEANCSREELAVEGRERFPDGGRWVSL